MSKLGVRYRQSLVDEEGTEEYRSSCDLMNLFFVFDELSDAGNEDQVRVLADTIMDGIRNPHETRLAAEPIVGLIAKQ